MHIIIRTLCLRSCWFSEFIPKPMFSVRLFWIFWQSQIGQSGSMVQHACLPPPPFFLFVLIFWGIFKREHKLPKCLVCSRGFHLKKKKIQTHKSNQAYGESFYQTFMTSGKFRFAQTCLYVLKLSPFLFKHCPILPTIPKYSFMEKCSYEFSCLYLSRKMHREGRLHSLNWIRVPTSAIVLRSLNSINKSFYNSDLSRYVV